MLKGYKIVDYTELVETPKDLLGKRVGENDFTGLECIYPNTIITYRGEPLIVYGKMPDSYNTSIVRSILPHVKYSTNRRLTQLQNKTEVSQTIDINFGYNPPNRIFNTSAGACLFNQKYPNWYKELVKLGAYLANEVYALGSPERFKNQTQFLKENILPNWQMKGTPFTQGVINDANALGYHFDRDNVPGGWSCMVYFKHAISGGNLIVPALRAKFICTDRAFMLFDGQSIMHGVSPIQKLNENAYRYSIVYYARESMVGLGSGAEELARAQATEFRKHENHLKTLEKAKEEAP